MIALPRFFNPPPPTPDDFVSPNLHPSTLFMTIVNYARNSPPRPDNLHVPSIVISTNFFLSRRQEIAFLRRDSSNIANLSKERRARGWACPRVAIITLHTRSCVREIIQVTFLPAVKFLFDDSCDRPVGRGRISLFPFFPFFSIVLNWDFRVLFYFSVTTTIFLLFSDPLHS